MKISRYQTRGDLKGWTYISETPEEQDALGKWFDDNAGLHEFPLFIDKMRGRQTQEGKHLVNLIKLRPKTPLIEEECASEIEGIFGYRTPLPA